METQPRPGNLLGLKILVGVLGVLIVLGTALVIGIVIHRLYAKPAAPSMLAPAAAKTPGAAVAPAIASRLPAGDYIKAIAAAGADVAIWIGGPNGDKVLLVDPVSGKVSVAVAASP